MAPHASEIDGYCLFAESTWEGSIPLCRDENGSPVIFDSLHDAQRELADRMIAKLQEFIEERRDFEDATSVDEHIVEVAVDDLGVISDEHGNAFAYDSDRGLIRVA